MVKLIINNDNEYILLKISKQENYHKWKFELGPWHKGKSKEHYQPKNSVFMSKENIKEFSKEISHALYQDEYEFILPVDKKSPLLKVSLCKAKTDGLYEKKIGKFEFSVLVNAFDRGGYFNSNDENYTYMYEGKGKYIGLSYCFLSEDLKQFADDLEAEAKGLPKKERKIGVLRKIKQKFNHFFMKKIG